MLGTPKELGKLTWQVSVWFSLLTCLSVRSILIYCAVREVAGQLECTTINYQLMSVWISRDPSREYLQLVVRKDSILVPDRDSKTIIQYSLAGEVERRIPCLRLNDAATWLHVMSPRCDVVIVSCDDTLSCINVGTEDYV